MVTKCHQDDKYRREAWRETRDWDFITERPKTQREKTPRAPREKIEPVHFSFEE